MSALSRIREGGFYAELVSNNLKLGTSPEAMLVSMIQAPDDSNAYL
jgi:hypothetical protein